MSNGFKSLMLIGGLLVVGAGVSVLAQGSRGTVSDYTLEYAETGITADAGSSSDYSIDSTIQIVGAQGGDTNSTDYSITSGIVTAEEGTSNVKDWMSFRN